MHINNISDINFGTKLPTVNVLETTCLRTMKSETITDLKPVIDAFGRMNGKKATGHVGYRYYLEQIGRDIVQKYPQIAEATADIKSFMANNPKASKGEIYEYSKQYIDKLGETIDIII